MSDTALLALIALISIACQWTAWRLKLPAILFLLISGIVLGPIVGVLNPDNLFQDLLFPIVSLSIAIILFEGSLTLHFKEVKEVGRVVRRLVTWGALVTWALISLFTHWLIGLPAGLSALFGALVVVTGPTVIVPMLRTVRATSRVSNILRWEGIIIDPIGALMAVLVYEWLISHNQVDGQFLSTIVLFGEILLIGTLLGASAAIFIVQLIRRHLLPEYLHAFGTLALVLITFTLSNSLAHESGLLAVTVMGIWIANSRGVHIDEILTFKEHLTILLISGLFIVLAARMDLDALLSLGLPALLLLAVIQFIVRPISVALCSIGSDLTWQEKSIIAWIGPRGIVAAAVSALFALRLEEQGYAQAPILTALTFAVIIGTVVFQSATSRWVANRLGVTEPEPRGLVIIGANRVARAIADVLQKNEIPTLLIDPSWENIREARMQGLKTLHGNPLSNRVSDKLELVGFGQMLAATPQNEVNTLSTMHFKNDFSQRYIYAVNTQKDSITTERQTTAKEHQGQVFGEDAYTFKKLSSLISQEASIRATRISSDYTFTDWQSEQGEQRSLLMAISPEGRLRFFTPETSPDIREDWLILSIDRSVTDNYILDTNSRNPTHEAN